MTSEQFNIFWNSNFDGIVPIPHYFKHVYEHRWFRIHSLPASKRYADNEHEWNILLNRQNNIITDLFGNNANLLLITGEYNYNPPNNIYISKREAIFNKYSFTFLNHINLHKLSPDKYDEGQTFKPAFSKIIWNLNNHDALLKAMANGEINAFFISPVNKFIVAPYEGGIDFILNNTATRDSYKQKYKQWLSERTDGL
jgi:hypothetical protein